MSVTLDAPDVVIAAKARVRLMNGRNGAARRSNDPKVIAARRSDLTTAVIACEITTAVANWPHLSVPQRLELIDLLMPSDRADVDEILGILLKAHTGSGADEPT